jgi:hypothetical protein
MFFPAVGEQAGDTFGLIPMAGPPNRGFIALELISQGSNPVARSTRQDDSGALHLEPRQALAPSDLQKVLFVDGMDVKSTWFSAAHGRMSPGNLVYHCQLNLVSQFRAAFLSGDTRPKFQGGLAGIPMMTMTSGECRFPFLATF